MIDDEISIGGTTMKVGGPTYVIAEIGSNHDQSLDRAKQLIEIAAEAGANGVKFQLYKASDLVNTDHPAHTILVSTELQEEWLPVLAAFSRNSGVQLIVSAFSVSGAELLESSGIAAHKVASSEALNIPLLRYLASSALPVLVSIGMCSWVDVEMAMGVLQASGKRDIIPLQCISRYPLPIEQANLRVIPELSRRYRGLAGFSDHTESLLAGACAVVSGASVVEKHLTWSRAGLGPDHSYALEPQAFRQYCENIREAEAMLGSAERLVEPEERAGRRRVGLVITKDLAPGDLLTKDNVSAQGPQEGIPAYYLSGILGCTVRDTLKAGDRLHWEAI